MEMRRISILTLVLACCMACLRTTLWAQSSPRKFDFFQRGLIFNQLILDPTECQVSLGFLGIKGYNGKKGTYGPVNIGFQQSILRFTKPNYKLEFGLGAASFTQFFIEKVDEQTVKAEMENADYKLSFYVNYKKKVFSLRTRYFHISSHFSDDYILRNQITSPDPGTLNYEQLDMTASWELNQFRYYGGAGVVVTPHAIRERLSFQAGFHYRKYAD